MDPSGRLRRRRRVAMTKKGAAAVPIEENRQPSPVLEQPVFEMAALESDKTKPVESEMNGHATAEPVEKDEKLSVGAKSTDNQLAANGLVPEASSKAGFTTPTKEKTRAVTRARRGNGARGAVDVESSPPKMRTRSAVKAERKITDFFRPAENGEAAATNGAVTPPPSPISMAFRSPVLDGNEEKENKVAPVLGASAKPSSTHVRVLNWEPESVEHSTAKTLMPTPPHRIQSPLKPEVREVRCRSTTPPGAVGVVEDILSTLSPSSALNKMKISFDEPPKRLPEEPVVKERVRRPRKPATPKKRPQEPQQPQPLPPPPPPPAHPEQPKQQQQASHTKQSTLTTFFQPIRRSSRKTKAALAKETEWQIAEAVRNGKEDGLSVENFPCKGRGIVAARPFTKGEFVVEYSGELIDMKEAEVREAQYARDKTAGCYMYYFEYQNRQLCVDATKESGRMGRLINHSRSHANLTTKTIMIDDAPRLVLFAGRDIAENEELLYDYGDRRKESLANYPWLAF